MISRIEELLSCSWGILRAKQGLKCVKRRPEDDLRGGNDQGWPEVPRIDKNGGPGCRRGQRARFAELRLETSRHTIYIRNSAQPPRGSEATK